MPNPDLNATFESMQQTAEELKARSKEIAEAARTELPNPSDRAKAPIKPNLGIAKAIVQRIKYLVIETAALTLLIAWGFWVCRTQKLILWEWRIAITILLLAIFAIVTIVQASLPTRQEQEQLKKIFYAAADDDSTRFQQLIRAAFAEREGRFLLIVEISIALISANLILTYIRS